MSKLSFGPEVEEAMRAGRPLVALESTIISHGMPYPLNLETAIELESIIRDGGAVPATIAIIAGQLRVGLTQAELQLLAENRQIAKVSIRDLPAIVARRQHGATTVAATMRISAMAGIKVFATGGIGGVHRGGAQSFDVSADLTELATSQVAVISAGAKAILDLALTLEKLETLGVPVVAFGQDDFPAFYSRSSGLQAPLRADRIEDLAAIIRTKWEMGLGGGVLVANPIPPEAEIPGARIELAIEDALAEADRQGVTGKALTPFLLSHLADSTQGESQEANMALVRNNAVLGAQLAQALT